MKQEDQERYQAILENTYDLVCEIDTQGRFLFISNNYERILGYTKEELIGKPVIDFGSKEEINLAEEKFDELLEKREDSIDTWRFRCKNGEWRYFEATGKVYQNDMGETRVVVISRDVTEQRRRQEALRQALADRDILMKELNHRVKNNLAIIQGLINFSKYQTEDQAILDILTNLSSRIFSIASIHDSFGEIDSINVVDIAEYISTLINHTISAMSPEPNSIFFNNSIEPQNIRWDKVSLLGLCLNELASNSIKHGFRDKEGGTISISSRFEDSVLRIIYSDDGCGIKNMEALGSESKEHMGMFLIKSMVNQLDGRFEVNQSPGFSIVMEVPVENHS